MTRPLRIISVCRSLPTPVDPWAGLFVLNRIAALSRVSDLQIIQPIPYLPGVRPLPNWAQDACHRTAGMEILHAPMLYIPGSLKSLDGAWLARSIGPVIEQAHRLSPIDLIDAHFGYPDGAGCVTIGRRLGIPVFITLRGLEEDRVRESFVRRKLVEGLRGATGCITVSQSLRDLALRCGVDRNAVQVIHNAIDGAIFQPGARDAAQRRLGVQVGRPLVVSVGRLIALKRHHVLIDAFSRIRSEFPAASLAIIGPASFEPGYPGELERQIGRLGLQSAVHLVGNVPQSGVADWLRAADAFALLSAREGCSNAVLEALAVGVPVVATDAGDNALFVRPSLNGDIVPVDDVPATARALLEVLRRPEWDRARISRQLMSEVGSWQAVAERVLAFFRDRLEIRSGLTGRRHPAYEGGHAHGG